MLVSSTRVRTILPEKDENGRTQFFDTVTKDDKVTIQEGVYLDSEKDTQATIEMNKRMEEVRRDFINKSNASEASAALVYLD